MSIQNINKIFKNLEKEIERKSKAVSGNYSFSELFNDDFMKSHTSLSSLDEFFKLNNIQTKEDFENLSNELLDKTVKNISNFSSFQEMFEQAATEIVVKNWNK